MTDKDKRELDLQQANQIVYALQASAPTESIGEMIPVTHYSRIFTGENRKSLEKKFFEIMEIPYKEETNG